jgi:hypothetical protein
MRKFGSFVNFCVKAQQRKKNLCKMRPVCNWYSKLWLYCTFFIYATIERESQQQKQQLLLQLLQLLHLSL